MTLHPGTEIGRYTIDAAIGTGGFGCVYRASDPVLGRPVAVKILDGDGDAGARGSLQDCLREARAASALNHPCIVTVHDVGETDGVAYIVMEWVEGRTLRQVIQEDSPLPVSRVALYGQQLASALERAHEAGLTHRDLKPENVMVRPDDVVKILDFGLARHLGPNVSAQITAPARMAGTLRYMAPEQLKDRPLGASVDLFALGALLYEMLTGRHPFEAASAHGVMQKILHEDPAPPGSLVEVPAGWDDMVMSLLAREPSVRESARGELSSLLAANASVALAEPARLRCVEREEHVVGRARDLEMLASTWREAVAGRGSFAMVVGEPGAGKTTLCQSFLDRLRDDGPTLVAVGRCSERLGAGEPYLPFLEALGGLCGTRHGALIRAIIKSKAPTWFTQLFPAGSTDSAETVGELVGGSQERMRRELVDAMDEIGRTYAVCLLLEDLHWSDLATTELMAYMAKHVPSLRCLILGTYRPSEMMQNEHPLRPIILEMVSHRTARELQIGFLTRDDIAAYLELEYPGHRFDDHLADWVHRKTEGTPLFMVDLLRYMQEQEALVKQGNEWVLARSLDELQASVPASVRSMIERKMELLSDEQRRLLSVASVQGDVFDSLTLSEVAEVDELRLEEELERLARVHRLIQPVDEMELPDDSLTVRHKFVHVLYQNALYQSLTGKRRLLLHARVGEAIESHLAGSAGSRAAELAQHFDRARRARRALPYYRKAAANAVAKFAQVQGRDYCNRALDLVDKLPEGERDEALLSIYRLRGKILFVMSRFEESAQDMEAMRAAAERLGDPEKHIEALVEKSMALFWAKKDEDVEEHADRIVELANQHDLPEHAGQAHLIRGMLRMCYGDMDDAGRHLAEAEKASRAGGFRSALTQSITWRAEWYFFRSDYERAGRWLRKAEAIAIENHDGFAYLMTHFFAGLTQANSGNLIEAVHTLERGRSLAEKNNDLFWLGRFPNCLAWTRHEALDFETALARNLEAVTIARQTGFLEGEANAVINVGLAAIGLGDLDRAEASFTEVESIFARDDWYKWRYRLRLLLGQAELRLAQERFDEARRLAGTCRDQATRAGARKYMAQAHRVLGRIAVRAEDIAAAASHLRAAETECGDLQAPLVAWRVYADLADFHRARGNDDAARDSAAAARQLLEMLARQAPEAMARSILGSRPYRELS